jgi:hypothetical protein
MAPFLAMILSHWFMPILLNPNAMYGLYYGLGKALGCGTETASVKDENKTELPLDDTKEIQYDDSSISWPDQVLETGNIFELDLESNGIRGETDHSKKSSTF